MANKCPGQGWRVFVVEPTTGTMEGSGEVCNIKISFKLGPNCSFRKTGFWINVTYLDSSSLNPLYTRCFREYCQESINCEHG